jgi:hypothetical protein
LRIAQATRSPGLFSVGQAGKAVRIEAMDPILHRARRIAQQLGHFRAGQSLRNQKHAMQAVVIARLL